MEEIPMGQYSCLKKMKEGGHHGSGGRVGDRNNETFEFKRIQGGDVAQLFRAPDRHAADEGSIPRCGKGFFSLSQLSVQTRLRVFVHPVCNRMRLHLCAR